MTPLIDWQWKMLSEPTGHPAAAAYAVRLLNHGPVVRIPRFLGIDSVGLLTIGKTIRLEQRRLRFFRFDLVFGIQPLEALWANAVSKLSLGVLADIGFHLLPVALVVPYLLTGRADWEQSAEGIDVFQGLG